MSDKIDINVKIVPVSGKVKSKKAQVAVTVTGTTVREIANQLVIDLTNRNVSVNGQTATPDTIVGKDAKVEFVEIRVAERPRGS